MGLFNKIKSIADDALEITKEKISSFIDYEKIKEIAFQYFVKIDFSVMLNYLRKLEPLNPKLSIVILSIHREN